jgi:DNA-binding NarL/FixJ family response regulator
VDPVRSLAAIARLVRSAHAGVVVSADGSAEPLPGLNGLTPRELGFLGRLVDGRSNREIARALVVAQRTVPPTSSTSWSNS